VIEARVTGIPEYKAALLSVVPKLRKRALLDSLKAGARVVSKEAKANTPVLKLSTKTKYRKPGAVRKAISVRTSKIARRRGDVGVFVNVRPAKKGLRGAKSPSDVFYWRFLEFGTKKMRASKFLQAGAKKLDEALSVFTKTLGPQIEKLNRKSNL